MWVEKTREFLTSKKYSKDYVTEGKLVTKFLEIIVLYLVILATAHDETYEFNEEEYEHSLKENPAIYNSNPIAVSILFFAITILERIE